MAILDKCPTLSEFYSIGGGGLLVCESSSNTTSKIIPVPQNLGLTWSVPFIINVLFKNGHHMTSTELSFDFGDELGTIHSSNIKFIDSDTDNFNTRDWSDNIIIPFINTGGSSKILYTYGYTPVYFNNDYVNSAGSTIINSNIWQRTIACLNGWHVEEWSIATGQTDLKDFYFALGFPNNKYGVFISHSDSGNYDASTIKAKYNNHITVDLCYNTPSKQGAIRCEGWGVV